MSALLIVVNRFLTEVPMALSSAMATTEIRPAIKAYSICKHRLDKVQATLGQYFQKDGAVTEVIPRKLPSVIFARSDRTTLVTGVDGASWTRTVPADVATVRASRSTLWMVPRICSACGDGEALLPDASSEIAAQSNAERMFARRGDV